MHTLLQRWPIRAPLVITLLFLAARGSFAAPVSNPVSPSNSVSPPLTQPSTAAQRATSVESEPIRHAQDETPTAESSPDTTHVGNLELPRVAGAMAIVIALIFLLRWGGQRLFNTTGAARAGGPVKVLSRSPLAPRQQIMLLQVGTRVIVVAESGSQMTSLCQITDSDEVAALIGQLHQEKAQSAGGAFGSLFRRAKDDIDAGVDSPEPHPELDATGSPATEENEDAAIQSTRDELQGLMSKIRLVSRQLKNG